MGTIATAPSRRSLKRERMAGEDPRVTGMQQQVRLLMVEDVVADAELAVRELKRAGIRTRRKVVESEKAFREALERFQPELILSDFSLPGFDGMRALEIAREKAPRRRSSSYRERLARRTRSGRSRTAQPTMS